jgi:hypothetical protein
MGAVKRRKLRCCYQLPSMLKIAPCAILASLVIVTPALADPMCESVTDRTAGFRQVHLDRYSELVKAVNSGNASDADRIEMAAREKIVDEAYSWLKLLSYSNVNGYTSNCWEIHFKLRRMGY